MKPEYKPFVDALIELAIREDIGDGDHTSLCCIPATEKGRMRLLCKQEVFSRASKSHNWCFDAWTPTCNSNRSSATATA